MPRVKTSPENPMLIPCRICGVAIDTSDEHGPWTLLMEDDGLKVKAIVHVRCQESAQEIFQAEDHSAEIAALNQQVNDLRLGVQEMQQKLGKSADMTSVVRYLEEFIETQSMSTHRAPKGSDYQRIAAFRVNDATDLLERIRALLPSAKKEE